MRRWLVAKFRDDRKHRRVLRVLKAASVGSCKVLTSRLPPASLVHVRAMSDRALTSVTGASGPATFAKICYDGEQRLALEFAKIVASARPGKVVIVRLPSIPRLAPRSTTITLTCVAGASGPPLTRRAGCLSQRNEADSSCSFRAPVEWLLTVSL